MVLLTKFKREKIMSDMIKIYLYKIANLLAYPFLKFRGYRLGVEMVADEFIALMRKVCIQGSFHHSFEQSYVKYSLFNGIFFKDDTFNQGFLCILKGVNKDGTMDINQLELKNIKKFERFCSDVESNYSSISERWSLNYKNKKINSITCALTIIPDYKNHRNRNIDGVKLGIVFDHDFNIVSIIKQNFTKVTSKYCDETCSIPVFSSVIENDILLNTELLLIKLAIASDNSPLLDIFPEYYKPTVYDYSSLEFEQRLLLLEMMEY